MTDNQSKKKYDLEERTFTFASRAVMFCRRMPKTMVDGEIGKQLLRAATSVGANYIEANRSLGSNDFLMKVKICRKEARESGYWLRLLELNNLDLREEKELLLKEADELVRIFGAIVTRRLKSTNPRAHISNSKSQEPN